MNLFEKFELIVNDSFITKIKGHLNDDLGDFEAALKGIFYTYVAGLIRRSNSDMSAGMMFNQVQEKYKTGEIKGSIEDLLNDKLELEKILQNGTKVISQIFPAFKSPLLSMISTYAGTSKDNTVFFSRITVGILVDMLGEKINSDKMDKSDLVFFLQQLHEPLFKTAPDSLMEKMIPALGLQELTQMKFSGNKKAEKAEAATDNDVSESKSSFLENNDDSESSEVNKKLILGILIGVLLLCIGYYLYSNNYFDSFINSDETPVEAVDEEIGYDSLSLDGGLLLDSLSKDSLQTVRAISNDDFSKFEAYIIDKNAIVGQEFIFSNIKYVGETFELDQSSNSEISKISQLMNNESKLQLKIIAFSATGDTKLENKRAFAVKKILMNNGISSLRIDASAGGKGGSSPKFKVVIK